MHRLLPASACSLCLFLCDLMSECLSVSVSVCVCVEDNLGHHGSCTCHAIITTCAEGRLVIIMSVREEQTQFASHALCMAAKADADRHVSCPVLGRSGRFCPILAESGRCWPKCRRHRPNVFELRPNVTNLMIHAARSASLTQKCSILGTADFGPSWTEFGQHVLGIDQGCPGIGPDLTKFVLIWRSRRPRAVRARFSLGFGGWGGRKRRSSTSWRLGR